ncbi:MAG: MFS transporter [Isosphaeraceae bacterium]|nr:MFS transporter [Isosphaeraceae bacterium]
MSAELTDTRDVPTADKSGTNEKLLFWACFIALIATAFGFVVRTQIMDDWQAEFGLSETQKGEIFGVGLWPFAVSIVLFSLIIDYIGYGKAMAIAFVCHVASAVITIFAKPISGATGLSPYWVLYLGTLIVALGNGTVEAVINPVVATLFPTAKTKWLNILHAGWPGGLVLGGILAILMGSAAWQYKVGLIFLPVIAYGLLMLGRRFPVNERVAAGVSYMAMLQQVGFLGALIVTFMIVSEVGRIFGIPQVAQWIIIGALSLGYGLYTRSLGQPLFIFLLLIMVPLATTELGTDSWITDLMKPEMARFGLNAGWLLVYTSLIMMILRFFAGPIVHKLSPLGLLACSALLAACGLVFLSKASGLLILAAATLYGFGKTFFWPTMLGVVAEQFPKGGALTLNATGGVGMLAVGVIGAALLGNIQDKTVDQKLAATDPQLHQQVVDGEKLSVFGTYRPIDPKRVEALPAAQQKQVAAIQETAKKDALMTVAIFPCIMFACYLGLLLYFQAKGGYQPQTLITEKEEELLMTGGAVGPDEF